METTEKWARRAEAAEAQVVALRSDLRDLLLAAEELQGWQNGPPLVTYTNGWNAAMAQVKAAAERARAALGETPAPGAGEGR